MDPDCIVCKVKNKYFLLLLKKYTNVECEAHLVKPPPPGGPIENRKQSFVHHGLLKLSFKFH